MADDPTARFPLDPVERETSPADPPDTPSIPDTADAPDMPDIEAPATGISPVPPAAPDTEDPATRGFGRDLALGAIAFVAVLLLLLGATRLMERGGAVPSPSASQAAAAPSPMLVASATAGPTTSPSAGASGGPTGSAGSPTPSGSPGASPAFSFPADDPVLVGAGDIGVCGANGDEDTAALLDAPAGTVFTAGDNAYESGSARDFARCYEPSWVAIAPGPGRPRETTTGRPTG